MEQTFKSFCKFKSKQRHCELAAVVRLTTTSFSFLNVEVVEIDICLVIANTDGVDDTTLRTRNQLVKQQVSQQEMTCKAVTSQLWPRTATQHH